jgi:ResB-like family
LLKGSRNGGSTVSENPSAVAAGVSTPALKRIAGASEQVKVVLLVASALITGGILQFFIEPGPKALVVAAIIAGAATFAASHLLPGRWREVMSGFRFTSVLLIALAIAAALGTLVLQGRPIAEYPMKYGAFGDLIVALRLDDIFHSLWFACLIALFGAAVVNSALLRWPVKLRNAGFFVCHVGLITSLAGAALSSYFAVRGRVEMFADGSTVNQIFVTKQGQVKVAGYDANGQPVPATAPLGFALRLDQFDLVRYATEYRIGYYEPRLLADGRVDWRLKASFDPEEGVKHLLPGGNSFSVKKLWAEFQPASDAGRVAKAMPGQEMKNPAAVLEVNVDGDATESPPLSAHAQGNFLAVPPGSPNPRGYLAFERREDEAKSYQSHVTAIAGSSQRKALVSVNDPFTYDGWTFYQVNYDPKNPKYSGLEAVYDPGVKWVFAGFVLIMVGVFYMFYVETRLKGRKPAAASAPVKTAA